MQEAKALVGLQCHRRRGIASPNANFMTLFILCADLFYLRYFGSVYVGTDRLVRR